MTSRRNTHSHAANVDHYGANDAAPFPGATWHYSDTATWPDHVTPAPTVRPRLTSTLINTESPAGAAFAAFCAGDLNVSEMSPSERDEFASVARMWLDTPAIAEPRNPEDAPLPGFLREFVAALEASPIAPTPSVRPLQPHVSMTPGELEPGMLVSAHGMLCRVTDAPTLSRSHAGGRTFYTTTQVINRADVSSDAVPYSFTSPRLSNGLADEAAIARGEHHWSFQGNDWARVAVVVHGPQPQPQD
jgi:hypothetical protein